MGKIVFNVSTRMVDGGNVIATENKCDFLSFNQAYDYATDLVDKAVKNDSELDYDRRTHSSNDTTTITTYSFHVGKYYEVKIERNFIN